MTNPLQPLIDLSQVMIEKININRNDINELLESEDSGLFTEITTESGVYAMDDDDTTMFMNTAAPTTINLQTAVGVGGRIVIIKDDTGNAGASNITINADGAENIDGLATQTISTNWGRMILQSNGVNWRIVST